MNVLLDALAVLCALAILTWGLSLWRRNVAIVDILWPWLFIAAACIYARHTAAAGPRGPLVLALVGIWGVRLSAHLAWRNWGQPEDRRYQAIRARNQPNFEFKSLYLVFLLQALLAWIVSWPLWGAMAGSGALGPLDAAGAALWLLGMVFEAGGDWQLSRFNADPAHRGAVMDQGLWRYTRHPNYFGDFCVWWGLYLLALSAGAGWSVLGPLLMSVLLMRVSGVTLLERDIGERRPGYAEYVRRTPAFFPRPPRP